MLTRIWRHMHVIDGWKFMNLLGIRNAIIPYLVPFCRIIFTVVLFHLPD